MSVGLLFNCDEKVIDWLVVAFHHRKFAYDRAVGIINKDGVLCGGVVFYNWNGANVEVGYYGRKTMTPGIIRCLAKFVIETFDVARMTVITSKKNRLLIKSLIRSKFKLEGTQRCYYGKIDCIRNTGVRFAIFRDRLDKVAGVDTENHKVRNAVNSSTGV